MEQRLIIQTKLKWFYLLVFKLISVFSNQFVSFFLLRFLHTGFNHIIRKIKVVLLKCWKLCFLNSPIRANLFKCFKVNASLMPPAGEIEGCSSCTVYQLIDEPSAQPDQKTKCTHLYCSIVKAFVLLFLPLLWNYTFISMYYLLISHKRMTLQPLCLQIFMIHAFIGVEEM